MNELSWIMHFSYFEIRISKDVFFNVIFVWKQIPYLQSLYSLWDNYFLVYFKMFKFLPNKNVNEFPCFYTITEIFFITNAWKGKALSKLIMYCGGAQNNDQFYSHWLLFSKPGFFSEKSLKLKYKFLSLLKCSFNSELFLFEPNQIS